MKRTLRKTGVCFGFTLLAFIAMNSPSEAGDAIFVRNSTGNWHINCGAGHYGALNWEEFGINIIAAGSFANIPAGTPSIVVPISVLGVDVVIDPITLDYVKGEYNSTLGGNPDHQEMLDHSSATVFNSQINSAGASWDYIQGCDVVHGDLTMSIAGDGVQWIDVTFDILWSEALSTTNGVASLGLCETYISVKRNGNEVVYIFGGNEGAYYADIEGHVGVSSSVNGSTSGVSTINNQAGFWAADGDQIEYHIWNFREYDSSVGYNGGILTGSAIFDWRFALEDSSRTP